MLYHIGKAGVFVSAIFPSSSAAIWQSTMAEIWLNKPKLLALASILHNWRLPAEENPFGNGSSMYCLQVKNRYWPLVWAEIFSQEPGQENWNSNTECQFPVTVICLRKQLSDWHDMNEAWAELVVSLRDRVTTKYATIAASIWQRIRISTRFSRARWLEEPSKYGISAFKSV